MKLAVALSVLALAAGPAAAETLEITDFVGRIDVQTGDTDRIEARIVGGEDMEPAQIDRDGDTVRIDGGWDRGWGGMSCRGDGDDLRIRIGEGGFALLGIGGDRGELRPITDYPLIQVTAPRDVEVAIDDSLLVGQVGDIGGGEIANMGCGDLRIGDVSSDLTASHSGSGALSIGDVGGSLEARLAGSGELAVGHVAGDLEGGVSGSGDLVVGGVDGAAEVGIAGSGDVELGVLAGGADISIAGSGDVTARSLSGDVEISVTGSGDVEIDDGSAGLLKVSIRGSGDVDYGGVADRAEVGIAGSGDVTIGAAGASNVDTAGSGTVRIGDSTFQ